MSSQRTRRRHAGCMRRAHLNLDELGQALVVGLGGLHLGGDLAVKVAEHLGFLHVRWWRRGVRLLVAGGWGSWRGQLRHCRVEGRRGGELAWVAALLCQGRGPSGRTARRTRGEARSSTFADRW